MPKIKHYRLNVVGQNHLFIVFNFSNALVTIATSNFEQLLEFYVHLFQQEPGVLHQHSYASWRLPSLHLGIFRPRDHQQFTTGRGSVSLCLEVDDLMAAINHAGTFPQVSTNEIMTASHGRESYIYDPDGNRIIFHQSDSAFQL